MAQPGPRSRPSVRRASLRAIMQHGSSYPFATGLSLVSIPIGCLALLIGQDISRAFTIVYHSPVPVHVWGAVLLFGGSNVAYGIAAAKPVLERFGLYVLAVAYAFYAVSVLVGLRVGGLVTGPTFIALAVACLQRAHVVIGQARIIARLFAEDEGADGTHLPGD